MKKQINNHKCVPLPVFIIVIGILVALGLYYVSENNAKNRDLQNKLEHIILHNGGYAVDSEGKLISE